MSRFKGGASESSVDEGPRLFWSKRAIHNSETFEVAGVGVAT